MPNKLACKWGKKSDDLGIKEDENVHFKLEALEEILEENYSKITDRKKKIRKTKDESSQRSKKEEI